MQLYPGKLMKQLTKAERAKVEQLAESYAPKARKPSASAPEWRLIEIPHSETRLTLFTIRMSHAQTGLAHPKRR